MSLHPPTSDRPPHLVVRGHKRVRALVDGHVVVDTTAPRLVWEVRHYPAYYLPRAHVRAQLLERGQDERGPMPGKATVYDLRVGDRVVEGAAWAFPDHELEELRELVRFDWTAADEWLEEDEPVYVHPRDPYHRVDVLASSRHVRVELDGETVAESRQPRILYETGLPPRYYLPLTDLRQELLRPSDRVTGCPYKGHAGYFSVQTATRLHVDVVWIYRTPLPESQKIAGLAAFYDERVDTWVDGERQERPDTPFSR